MRSEWEKPYDLHTHLEQGGSAMNKLAVLVMMILTSLILMITPVRSEGAHV